MTWRESLKVYRFTHDLTVQALAVKLKIHASAIHRLEQGITKAPSSMLRAKLKRLGIVAQEQEAKTT